MFDCKFFRGRIAVLLVAAALVLMGTAAWAQDQAPPKVDIFGGYSWGSMGKVPLTSNRDSNLPGASGWGAAATYDVTSWLGATADFSGHYSDKGGNWATLTFGPRLALRADHFIFFGEGLLGLARSSPPGVPTGNGFAFLAGGGVDLRLTRHFGLRLAQADFVRQNQDEKTFGRSWLSGYRLQTGAMFFLGGAPPTPVSATCSLQPTSVMAGQTINGTVTGANFNPKHTLSYTWKSSGGKIAPKDSTVAIDTTGLAAGDYTVNSTVTDPKEKQNNMASCNSTFTIQEPPKHPPTITCSSNPATVRSGDASQITCQSTNPDNRALSYDWKCSGGRITGNGLQGTLDTAGAPAGPITCTVTVSDDRGLTASADPSVNVEVPPPPPMVSKLNEIAFPNKQKPWRVDNTAKAILDDVALRLQREPDSKAVVVGYVDPTEKGGEQLAEQRAVNTKAYLTQEKGIDASRIDLRTGTAGGNRAEIYLVPPGSTFDVQGTSTFDASRVKAMPDKVRAKAPARKKKATAPAPPTT